MKNPVFDEEIRAQFLTLVEDIEAKRVTCPPVESPYDVLGFIIASDQFPRNLFRNSPRAFALDSTALDAAKTLVASPESLNTLLTVERSFVFLPFEHSEELVEQEQSLKLFETLVPLGSQGPFDYALKHFEIIRRFGRFPHRNAILGRVSTPEEEVFLKEPGSSF